jgi:hypothetical protein
MIGKFAIPASASGGGGTYSTVLREYTTSGTWTKPAGLLMIEILCIAGGGGGGGASNSPAGTTIRGGSGAQGGGVIYTTFDESDLGTSISYTIGAGGTGGAGRSDGGTGNQGAAGGNTTFGTLLTALGGAQGFGNGTAASAGRSSANNDVFQFWRAPGTAAATTGAVGVAGGVQGVDITWWHIGSAGSGGGLTSANAMSNGGAGYQYRDRANTLLAAAAGGTSSNYNGGNGASNVMNRYASTTMIEAGQTKFVGSSGAGGRSLLGGDGGDGGNGGLYGGAGGGGGASNYATGVTSGSGGNGGNGLIVIVEHIMS